VTAPADTRVECRVRWRTTRFGAASAMDAALNATSSATNSNLACRIMRYDNAFLILYVFFSRRVRSAICDYRIRHASSVYSR
jgi:hypothetical protein